MDVLQTVIHISSFIGTDNSSLFIDPYARRNVDHVVELGNQMLLINQRSVGQGNSFRRWPRSHWRIHWQHFGRHPWTGVLNTARVFCDGDDFEIAVFQFVVEHLPSWQIEVATSP